MALGLSLGLRLSLALVVCVEVEPREGVSEEVRLDGAVGAARALLPALSTAGSVGKGGCVAAGDCVGCVAAGDCVRLVQTEGVGVGRGEGEGE